MNRRMFLFGAILLSLNITGVAQRRAQVTPDTLVRNLYAAHKRPATDPFFQTKSHARLYKYFAKDLADLLWKDVATSSAKHEVGALDGDPLYNAQDTKITAFRINPPQYGEGNLNLADVPVTFKNFGKEQTILFRVERDRSRVWKITDIFYPGNPDDASSLRKILSNGQ